MRLIINIFIMLFLADASLSLFDDLLSLFMHNPLSSGLRNLLAGLTVLSALPVSLVMIIDRRMPKWRLMAMVVFLYFSFIAGWLFPSLFSQRMPVLFLSTLQLLIAISPYSPFTNQERTLLIPAASLQGPVFSWKHSLTALLTCLPLLLVILTTGILATADSYARQLTAGFMRIAPTGILMSDRTYASGNKHIRLISMIHIGEQTYYDSLFSTSFAAGTIVLAEGVTDKNRHLRQGMDYSKMAGLLGVSSQHHMRLEGRQIVPAEIGRPNRDRQYSQRLVPDILRADTDVSGFRPKTIAFLNQAGRHMQDSSMSFGQSIRAVNNWSRENMDEADNRAVMEDIIFSRNRVVIGYLDRVLPHYDHIIIPWGALHMAEIEQAVLKRGFKPVAGSERVSMDFWKLARQKL